MSSRKWPEYVSRTHLINSPSCLQATPYDFCDFRNGAARSGVEAEGAEWLKQHLHDDVEQLQMMKQHHVHLRNEETNKREPLSACRAKDNPKFCKGHYPRNRWLVERPIVLCRGCLKQMGLHASGKKCQLGAMHGPFSHAMLNATHSSMLAAQRCNSDVSFHIVFR